MKDQQLPGKADSTKSSVDNISADDQAAIGRRSLIKGAAGTLPLILTLQSGAALARSSNLITATTPENAKDRAGRTLCMDRRSVRMADATRGRGGRVYDLGEPVTGRVSAISRREYYSYTPSAGLDRVTEAEMCERGGSYYYRRRWGVRRVNVERGMLVSATALSSFADKIDVIDI